MERIKQSISFRGGNSTVAESMKAPLLSQETFNSTTEVSVYSVEVQEPAAKFSGTDKIVGGIVAVLLAAVVATSAAAMLEVHQIVVYVAGAVGILNVPLVAEAQYRIGKQIGLRAASQSLREQAELLKEERKILKNEINDLRGLVNNLDGIEEDLSEICKIQGYNSDTMVSLVKENEYTLMQMRKCLREVAMADIARIVMVYDRDNDMKICEKELSDLVLALRIRLEAHGIDLDVDKFKAMVRKDDDIAHIITELGKIMFDDETEHLDQDRLSAAVSSSEEEENLMSMFAIQDRYTRGAVAKARGSSISLSTRLEPYIRAHSGRQTSTMSDISRTLSRRLTLRFDNV
mmetsp:Transcript_10755/g.18373  ORF Transcript_10755/g.18373 Transcript_10755/m.18373 type:complete len:347 (+) Transcript_10755:31-1071(+)